ncbi:ABC transporter substrate-binding protein [Lactococcus nasutitermitis]|uniref:ABC transporter substrate-binding protein n=1 Tax=Lactococcus nasutitermitis TaxID=1652957 RepID=A0ABV9JE15_9LACT|nr:ABC transporter substrate-binding protein [Lactococcus nasutitermitis]
MKNKTKYLLALIVALFLLVIIVFAVAHNKKSVASSSKKDSYVLKLSDANVLCDAPEEIAAAKGFFKDEGLKYTVSKLSASTTNIEAIESGKIDAGVSLLPSVVQPLSNGAQFKITTGLHTGCLSILVPQNSPIKNAQDLKGKSIGVSSVAGDDANFARTYLTQNGLNVNGNKSDVNFIAYDGSELPIALQKGQVAAIAEYDPETQILEQKDNFKVLASSSSTAPFNTEICCVAYVSDKLAKEHPEIAKKYTRALQKAAAWVSKHQEEAVKIQIEQHYVAGTQDVNLKALDMYHWKASYKDGASAFKTVAKDLQKTGALSKDINVPALAKNSLLKLTNVK